MNLGRMGVWAYGRMGVSACQLAEAKSGGE
jgi:hypothetical protein